ncbi:hypothetical protein L1887_40671 [Cichorium endivia]|nr:hypothetical protein L1887_40671 [Cichorium endivia]
MASGEEDFSFFGTPIARPGNQSVERENTVDVSRRTPREVFPVVNGCQYPVLRVGPRSSVGSDCGVIEFTREDVESLVNEKITTNNRFSLKAAMETLTKEKEARLCAERSEISTKEELKRSQ